jgi:mono/diheme cytochrome c family protein
MRNVRIRSILGAILLLAALATTSVAHDETWKAPPDAAARTNPVPDTPQNRAKGRALYQKHCAMCHGDKGKGDGPAGKFNALPPHDLTDPELQQRMTDGEILWKITEGRKQDEEIAMPSMREKVPEEADRWKLVLFVRSLIAQP